MKAEFSSLGRDLFWKLPILEYYGNSNAYFEILRWTGYDDANWWNNVSNKEQFQIKGAKNGKKYKLNPETNEVEIIP